MAIKLSDSISKDIVKRIEDLISSTNSKPATIAKLVGGTNAMFTDWNSGKAKPSLAAVMAFADYFGVSLDYLVYGKENNVAAIESLGLTKSQSELLEKFDKLTPELQQRLIAYADFLMADMPDVKNEKGRLLG